MATSSAPHHTTQPEDDERLTAAIAHASIIANITGLLGLVLVVVLWATQRDRSRYVRAHIAQALAYQGATIFGTVLLLLMWSACLLLSLLPAALRPDLYRDGTLPDTFWLALFGLFLPLAVGFAATVYALYGAYQVYRGRAFIYPLAGRAVRRDLLPASSAIVAPAHAAGGTAASPPTAVEQPAPVAPVVEKPAVVAEKPVAPPIEPAESVSSSSSSESSVAESAGDSAESLTSEESAMLSSASPIEATSEKPATPQVEPPANVPQALDVFPPAPVDGNHTAQVEAVPPAVDEEPASRQPADQPPDR